MLYPERGAQIFLEFEVALSTEGNTGSEDRIGARNEEAIQPRSLLILLCVWFATYFAGIFSPPLMDDVDAIHMEAAKEMVLRHDYVTLYVDGIRYLDKPPLPYWLGALGFHLFGFHDWAARIVLAIAALVLSLYLYGMGRRWFDERTGFYAAGIFVTCVGPYIFTRFFIPDIIVALWMTISADLILRMVRSIESGGVETGRATVWQAVSFALVCTGAVLTKGLIGVVFPLGMLFLYLLLTGRLRFLGKMRLALGSLVFLVTVLPWHILAAIRNAASGESRGFLWFYFVNDQINRYLNKRIPRDYDKVPLLTFWVLVIVWVMPWGIFLAGAVRRWWLTRRPFRDEGPRLLLAIWAFVIIGFFTFSTRQEYYTLPAIPALALLIALYLRREDRPANGRDLAWVKTCSLILFCIGILVAIVCGYFAIVAHTPAPGAELYEELTKHPEDYQLSFGHLFDLTTTAFGFFRVPLAGMAISMFAMTGLSYWFRRGGKGYASNVTLILGMAAVITFVHQGLSTFYPILGSEPLAKAIRQQWRSGDTVVIDGEYTNGSSVHFYLGEPVYMLNGRINNLWYGSLYADAPHRFETTETFLPLWQAAGRVFFITHDPARTQAWQKAHGGTVVASSSGKYVLLNHVP